MPKDFKKAKGFLLVEMIVVLSIAITLTALLSVYTRRSEDQVVFFKEQTVLVNALSRAKSFAIEAFQPELQPGLPAPQERICGWGVHFKKFNEDDPTSNQYIIFRDLASGGICLPPQYTPGGTEDFEIITLPPALEISCLAVSQSSAPAAPCDSPRDDLDVVYIPPDPKIVFSTLGDDDEQAIIVLRLADGTRSSTIRVSVAGQISFD